MDLHCMLDATDLRTMYRAHVADLKRSYAAALDQSGF